MPRITAEQIAPIMGRNPQAIRVGLQNGQYPFGTAYKKDGSTHYTYDIYPKKFYELYGRLPEGVEIDKEESK